MIDRQDPVNSRGYILVGNNSLSGNIGTLTPVQPIAPARLVIENGATMTDQSYGSIGNSADSAGEVIVQNGGFWNLANNGVGYLNVGESGSGTLAVLNGGSVTIGNIGTFLSNGTNYTAGGIGIGQSIGASGTVLVSGAGSEISTLYGVTVGRRGQGILSIMNGGSVLIASGGIIAGQSANATASGTILVGGSGQAASLTIGPQATVATIGGNSTGTLIVADGGTVNLNDTGYLSVGNGFGVAGTVIVGGTTASAVIAIGTGGITDGNLGTGDVVVNRLGTISLTGTGGIGFGEGAVATGALTVDGGLVALSGKAGMGLGGASGGSGSVLIENGGSVSLAGNWLTVGSGSGGTGTVTVTGSGSTLEASGTAGINIGNYGAGTVSVLNGAGLSLTGQGAIDVGDNNGGSGQMMISGGTVTDGNNFYIGFNSGSNGTVTVHGGSSKLNVTNQIEVGASGSGTLLSIGAAVTAGALSVGGSTSAPQSSSQNLLSLTGFAYLVDSTSLAVWNGSTVSLDHGSSMDVGASNIFDEGAIYVGNSGSIIGNGLVAAAVVNNALIEASSATAPNAYNAGTLDIEGNISGTGAIGIAANAIFRADGSVAAGQVINFGTGGGSELILADPTGSGFGNAITGLATGDKIAFGNGFTITSASVVNGNTIAVNYHGSGGVAATYDLTNVSFAPGTNTSLSSGTDPNSGLAYIQLQPQYFNWQGGFGTSYGTPNNWQGGFVPNATDTANFINNPGTVTGSGSALSLTIGNYNGFNSGTWTFAGINLTVAGSSSPPYLPFAIGFYANTVLNGGTLNAAGGDTNIGNSNGVTVIAEDGAQVTTLGDSVGTNSGQSGTLVVTGIGTKWTEVSGAPVNGSRPGLINVGGSGPNGNLTGSAGYLIITNGAWVNTEGGAEVGGFSLGGYGAATLSAGALWTVGSGFSVGNSGDGTLAINGGTLNAAAYVAIGQNIGAQGSVTVGAGGVFNAGTDLAIGTAGIGRVIVKSATADTGFGGIQIGLGNPNSVNATGGQGEADVGSGGTLGTQGNVGLGGNGSSGVLNVNNGGTVLIGTGLYVGEATESNGTIYGGTGALNIGAGGTVLITAPSQSNNTLVQIGTDDNSLGGGPTDQAEGDVTVRGPGALLDTNDNPIGIGQAAIGNLSVSQGGTVLAGVSNSTVTALGIGRLGAGNLTLTDPGSKFVSDGYVFVGRAGTGSLVIENHASMVVNYDSAHVSGAVVIGTANGSANSVQTTVQTGGSGSAEVTSGGDLYAAQNVSAGQYGATGVLTVNTGGTVEAAHAITIGLSETLAAGGTLITATGTTIVSEATLLVGQGVINVGPGGLLKADGSGITSAGTSDILVGDGVGASGALNVTGAGATVDSGGYRIGVGAAGYGSLLISQGGTVLAATPYASDEAIYAGGSVGATGAVTISDPGSELIATGQFLVGSSGWGSLLIEN